MKITIVFSAVAFASSIVPAGAKKEDSAPKDRLEGVWLGTWTFSLY